MSSFKKRKHRGIISTIFCCFRSKKTSLKPFQNKPIKVTQTSINNTAAVITQQQPNNNDTAFVKSYEDEERDEELKESSVRSIQ